jgi:hypothetical protein
MRGLAPVGWLEGRELSTPAPGPVTRALTTAHREYVRRTATPVPDYSVDIPPSTARIAPVIPEAASEQSQIAASPISEPRL